MGSPGVGMSGKIDHGYLALADISGFTHFVAASELEHSQDVLAELIELIVAQLTPLLHLVEVEGDAVYVYAEASDIGSGDLLVDLYEATYVAFRDRVEGIRLHTTCTCNACRLIPTLDLKFITHCGEYYMQSVAGRLKPVGSPVNLLHRLVKNSVSESTGWQAYALFSKEALEHLGLPSTNMHHQTQQYEHLGEVDTFSFDLRARYAQITDQRRVMVTPGDADVEMVLDIAAPPPIVWEWLNDPQKRGTWQGLQINAETAGRRGVGTRNHCLHGKRAATIQTILDWRPFDYFTYESQSQGKPKPDMQLTHRLEATDSGTRLTVTMKLLAPVPALARRLVGRTIVKLFHVEESYQNLRRLLADGAPPSVPSAA